MARLFSRGNPYGAYQIINKCNDLLKVKEDPKLGYLFFHILTLFILSIVAYKRLTNNL